MLRVPPQGLIGSLTISSDMLAKGAVTVQKTDFLTPVKNLFDSSKMIMGQLMNKWSGVLSTNASYNVSDYIPVVAGVTYTISKCRNYCLFDSQKIYKSGVDNSTWAVQTFTPAISGYLRLSIGINDVNITQVEIGSSATTVEPYGVAISNFAYGKKVYALEVIKSGTTYYIRSELDSTNDIILTVGSADVSQNGCFGFVTATLVDRGSALALGGAFHILGDDITPIRTFTTIGANHGYTCIVQVTMVGHDKTTADLGSQWTDGTTTYTLLAISGNNLTFGCPYTVTDEIVSSTAVNPVANLTHVSGATHTTTVNISTLVSSPQLYPSINNIAIKFVLDGQEITKDGTYYGDCLHVYQSYNIMCYKEIIDWAQANIGVSYNNDTIAGTVRMSIDYMFGTSGSCVISHNIRALKKVTLASCGFIQAYPMSMSGHTLSRYIPELATKSGVNFATLVDMSGVATDLTFTSSDLLDATKPPNRSVDWLINSSTGAKKIGFAMGYFPDKSDGSDANRLNNSSGYLWNVDGTTHKNYPTAIYSVTLNPGDYKSFLCYRTYISPTWAADATNFCVVKDRKDVYVIVDYHENASYANIILKDYIGYTITTVSKSDNFTLHNTMVNADGVIFSVTNNYGYAILKLS